MSEYSELIKRFDKIRAYMRDFYVYGFKSREEFSGMSLRSYDNEKRRIESYLSDFLSFRQDENGKNVFISVDCASIDKNPLYRAFKSKTFTKNDISLNFFILDILTENKLLSVNEISEIINDEYLKIFENPNVLDLSTIRNKLNEYVNMGILTSFQSGKKLLYALNKSDINTSKICDAIAFFSEISPVGVVGSFIMDKCNVQNKHFFFKHHYIMQALDSEIVYIILGAMHEKKKIEILNQLPHTGKEVKVIVTPLKFLISVQGGRRYISCFTNRTGSIVNYRIEYIKSVKALSNSENYDDYYNKLEEILSNTWGSSFGNGRGLENLSMTISISSKEKYIIDRINREGRGGILTKLEENTYLYEIEVYDTQEMLPWIRTFIGRIKKLECSNKKIMEVFYNDLDSLYKMYGGNDNAI